MKKLGFGFMRLPLTDSDDIKSIDQARLNRMVDHYIQSGFTYFDTAYLYHQGLSEPALRRAVVDRYPRDSFFIADKMPVFFTKSADDYPKFFAEQLNRCGVDYFDYYLLHNLGAQTYALAQKDDGFGFMRKLKEDGRARKIGFSFHDKAELLEEILENHPEMEFVQLQINYADWEDTAIESRKCYELARKYNKPIIVMEPIKGGALANPPEDAAALFKAHDPDASVASWAMRYAASLEGVFMILSGMNKVEQLQDNINTINAAKPLSTAERDVIKQAVDMISAGIAIPCTNCRYCIDECPKNIPISTFFSLYNNQEQFGPTPAYYVYYNNLAKQFAKASDCIKCKKCESHCPQHINITENLEKVAEVFEQE